MRSKECRLVILDDNFIIRQTLGLLFKKLGENNNYDYRIYTSGNGIEGLGYVYVVQPDFIIVDTTLPKYAGKETVEFLLDNSSLNNTKAIIVLDENEIIASKFERIPQNFFFLDKKDKSFLPKLVGAINRISDEDKIKINDIEKYKFAKLSSKIIWYSNRSDYLMHSIQNKKFLNNLSNYIFWVFSQIILSFYLVINKIFYGSFKDENVDQIKEDSNKYRVKYYPTFATLLTSFILIVCQLSIFILGGFTFLNQRIYSFFDLMDDEVSVSFENIRYDDKEVELKNGIISLKPLEEKNSKSEKAQISNKSNQVENIEVIDEIENAEEEQIEDEITLENEDLLVETTPEETQDSDQQPIEEIDEQEENLVEPQNQEMEIEIDSQENDTGGEESTQSLLNKVLAQEAPVENIEEENEQLDESVTLVEDEIEENVEEALPEISPEQITDTKQSVDKKKYSRNKPMITFYVPIEYKDILGIYEISSTNKKDESTSDVEFGYSGGIFSKNGITYQISPDGNTWYYFDGENWEISTPNWRTSNTIQELNKYISEFENNTGEVYFRVFLHSDGDTLIKLEDIIVQRDLDLIMDVEETIIDENLEPEIDISQLPTGILIEDLIPVVLSAATVGETPENPGTKIITGRVDVPKGFEISDEDLAKLSVEIFLTKDTDKYEEAYTTSEKIGEVPLLKKEKNGIFQYRFELFTPGRSGNFVTAKVKYTSDNNDLTFNSDPISSPISSTLDTKFRTSSSSKSSESFLAKPIHNATFSVDSTGDGADVSAGNGICADAGGDCTLRAAIEETNALAGADIINFALLDTDPNHYCYDDDSTSGQVTIGNENTTTTQDTCPGTIDPDHSYSWFRIQPGSAFPLIIEGVEIDGISQTGSSCNAGNLHNLKIEINGSLAGATTEGIVLSNAAHNSNLHGLNINSFAYRKIRILNSDNHTLQCNFIGTDISGTLDKDTGLQGLYVYRSSGNQIGGDRSLGEGNVISGNNNAGLNLVNTGLENNLVQGNFIGTDKTGELDLGNTGQGILIQASGLMPGIFIGDDNDDGSEPSSGLSNLGNLISGNDNRGIWCSGAISCDGFVIRGNYIGTDDDGLESIPNELYGLILSDRALVENNLVSGNTGQVGILAGIENVIVGNIVGLNRLGTSALPNLTGIETADSTFVGIKSGAILPDEELLPTHRNIVSGNTGNGIIIKGNSVTVKNNFVGTNISGTASISNNAGIRVQNTNTIGGTASNSGAIEGNVVSGNTTNGFSLVVDGVILKGNIIGTDIGKTIDIGNGGIGISLSNFIDNTFIGGSASSDANYIAYNNIGISMPNDGAGNTLDNTILSNSIWNNDTLGIDITGTGQDVVTLVNPNDVNDSDIGANDQINYPVIDRVSYESSPDIDIQFDLDIDDGSDPAYLVQIFGSNTISSSGYGEGRYLIDSIVVTGDVTDNSVTLTGPFSDIDGDEYVSATVTECDDLTCTTTFGSTSEFSASILFDDEDGDGVVSSVDLDDDNDGILDTDEEDGVPGRDTDSDGREDRLDIDADGDGIVDLIEAGGTDGDNDGLVDGFTDLNSNGYDDTLEVTPLALTDTDGTGQPDFQDTDSDDDTVSDLIEANDTDFDGVNDVVPLSIDADGDGLDKAFDLDEGGTAVTIQDLDNDGVPDYLDNDDDDDTLLTALEDTIIADGNPTNDDADVDGLPDYLDGPFIVNSTADTGDNNTGDGNCNTGAMNAQGLPECTLRAAIEESNAIAGADAVYFVIPNNDPNHLCYEDDGITGNLDLANIQTTSIDNDPACGGTSIDTDYPFSWFRISPATEMQIITSPLEINGITQSGALCSTSKDVNHRLKIEMYGGSAGAVDGLEIIAGGSRIRGLNINSFEEDGIEINSLGANEIECNFIGTDISATNDSGNALNGIKILSVDSNSIGSDSAGGGNLISGNDQSGVIIVDGASGNTILGNFIGTTKSQEESLPNSETAITIQDSSSNIIGSNTTSNEIGFNDSGIGILGILAKSSDNKIINNQIYSHTKSGVFIYGDADNNTIGGIFEDSSNTIYQNTENGIIILENSFSSLVPEDNSILGNILHSNGDFGIELAEDSDEDGVADLKIGTTDNDILDLDSGANKLQNYPELESVRASNDETFITGSLNSSISTTYRVEFFSSESEHSTGHGESETFLGSIDVRTNLLGTVSFSVVGLPVVAEGDLVSSTATECEDVDTNGSCDSTFFSTSEFGANAVVQRVSGGSRPVPTTVTATTAVTPGATSTPIESSNESDSNPESTPNSLDQEVTPSLTPEVISDFISTINKIIGREEKQINVSEGIEGNEEIKENIKEENIFDNLSLLPLAALILINLFVSPKLFFNLFSWLTLLYKKKKWGQIYNIDSKKPILEAEIRLTGEDGKVHKSVSGSDGSYGFRKYFEGNNTLFVSAKGYYERKLLLYLGDKKRKIKLNIGMIPLQTEDIDISLKQKLRMFFKSKLYYINISIFVLGFLISLINLINIITVFRVVIFATYIVELLIGIILNRMASELLDIQDNKK